VKKVRKPGFPADLYGYIGGALAALIVVLSQTLSVLNKKREEVTAQP